MGAATGTGGAEGGNVKCCMPEFFENVAGHALVGGTFSVIGGGKFGSGALAGGFSAAVTPYIPDNIGTGGGLATSSIVGGTASVLGGGKFGNGALTGAFGYLFNRLAHGVDISQQQGQSIVDIARQWVGTIYALVGDASQEGVGADCSGSTCKIYDAAGDAYAYTSSGAFAAAAAQVGSFPFYELAPGQSPQPGDVILFPWHIAIYAGDGMMYTTHGTASAPGTYGLDEVKNFGTPLGYYRFQTPAGGN